MEETTRRINPTSKDQVNHAVALYMHRRNYPKLAPGQISEAELKLKMLVDKQTSNSNLIAYTAHNIDHHIIDHSFSKFVYWVKETQGKSKDFQDLDKIVGPLFCHLYIELLQRKDKDKDGGVNFFKFHVANVEKFTCDDYTRGLINAVSGDSLEAPSLRNNFRSGKFRVQVNAKSLSALKKFLAGNCHVIILHMLQMWFDVEEVDDNEDDVETDMEVEVSKDVANGFVPGQSGSIALKNVLDAINKLKNEPPPIFNVGLSNLKSDINCGLINRELGIIVYSYNSCIYITSIVTLKQLEIEGEVGDVKITAHSDRLYDLSINKNTQFLASASNDKTVRLFDLQSYKHLNVYKGHNYPVYKVEISPNGCYIVSGSYDNSCRLWGLESSDTLRLYAGHTQEITALAFHPNSTYIMSGSADKNLRMWTINDGSPVRMFTGSKGVIYTIKYSSNGKYVASAGDDDSIRIWDLVAGKMLSEIKTDCGVLKNLVWCNNDTYLSGGTIEGIVQTWDMSAVMNNPDGHQSVCIKNYGLNANLLDLEYSFDTLGCLTAGKSQNSFSYVTPH